MKGNNGIAKVGSLAGIAACAGDIAMTCLMGKQYPGYNQFTDTMSKLGATNSPVGKVMSFWWIIMSILFIIMAWGFRAKFDKNKKRIRWAYWMIILYGLGEGMGSGIFPADHISHGVTPSLIIHNAFGGMGIAGIILLPFILRSQSPFNTSGLFKLLTRIVSCFGPAMLLMFTISKLQNPPHSFIFIYKGLWQRLLMMNYYIYLLAIATLMWRDDEVGKRKFLQT